MKNELIKSSFTSDHKKRIRQVRAWVKFNLNLKGYTLSSLASEHGITSLSLCTVFFRPYPKAERIIAAAIDNQPWDLWPSRYGEDHKPNRPNTWYQRGQGLWKPKLSKPKHIRKHRVVNGKKLKKFNHKNNSTGAA